MHTVLINRERRHTKFGFRLTAQLPASLKHCILASIRTCILSMFCMLGKTISYRYGLSYLEVGKRYGSSSAAIPRRTKASRNGTGIFSRTACAQDLTTRLRTEACACRSATVRLPRPYVPMTPPQVDGGVFSGALTTPAQPGRRAFPVAGTPP
jgi:hypothetical protein